jgi:carboxyl-terminal processing protease
MNNSTAWRLCFIVVLTALMVALTDAWAAKQADVFKQLDLLVEVRHELVENYVEDPDQLELIEAAVQGMVSSLNDPYTVFVPSEHVDQFSDRLTGSFSGIGAEIDMKDGRPRIVTPLEDSPAWKSGIMAGDVILEVDGVTTQDESQMEVIKRIKGEAGTDVVLHIRRETGDELDITITRAQISVQTVRGARRSADQSYDFMLDPVNKIGYIRISQFTDKTADELRAALEQLNELGAQGLILDLRFDPGGLLDSAVQVSNMFLTGGKRIVSTEGRTWPKQAFDSDDDTVMPDTPLVVLANESSASASEVVTGALSDNKRALFVGTRTFGKGSVQQVHGLDSGLGALKMTGAYYYLPNGRNIHKKPDAEVWGVDPDEGAYVPMTFEQYEKMIKVRREADTIRAENGHNATAEITPDYIENTLLDPQLAASLRAVLGKVQTDKWPTVGLANADELVRLRERQQLKRRRGLLLEELDRVEAELADGEDKAEDETQEEASDAKPEDDQATVAEQAEDSEETQQADVVTPPAATEDTTPESVEPQAPAPEVVTPQTPEVQTPESSAPDAPTMQEEVEVQAAEPQEHVEISEPSIKEVEVEVEVEAAKPEPVPTPEPAGQP